MERLAQLVRKGIEHNYSDLHIVGGHPVVFRRHGRIDFNRDERWRHEDVDDLIRKLLTPKQLRLLKSRLSVDFAMTIHRMRIRLNVFSSTRGLSLAIRLLPGRVPRLAQLNLHPFYQEFCRLQSGLILIGGATGTGKSTTIAALIEEINHSRPCHIITLEDPIEYRFLSKMAFIEQRELGAHMPSFEQGLTDCLREDPDVIVVGELREPETMRLTLNAVESGHLVIASMHATNTEDALYRICNSFPAETQELVRSQLSSTLALLTIQKLVFLKRAGFRVPHLSILKGVPAVKGMIRDNKFSQIENAVQTGKGTGMLTMEQYRREYIEKRDSFTHPGEIFRPSEEMTPEVIYMSPLVDTINMPVKTKPPRPGSEAFTSSMSFARPDGVDDGFHIIEEEASIDEIIEELNKADKSG